MEEIASSKTSTVATFTCVSISSVYEWSVLLRCGSCLDNFNHQQRQLVDPRDPKWSPSVDRLRSSQQRAPE